MSISLKKIALSQHQSQEQEALINPSYLNLVKDLEVQLSVRIGTLSLSIGELRQLKIGQLLSLNQKTNEPIELLLNNQVIALGELMSHEDQFALKITEITSCDA